MRFMCFSSEKTRLSWFVKDCTHTVMRFGTLQPAHLTHHSLRRCTPQLGRQEQLCGRYLNLEEVDLLLCQWSWPPPCQVCRSNGSERDILPAKSRILNCSTLWWPSGHHPQVASIGTEKIVVWNVDSPQNMSQASAGESNHLEVGSWDPHDVNNIATASEGSIHCWDLRSMSSSIVIDQAHALQTRHIDFNPQKKHIIATAGDDSWIRVWDLRKPSSPLHNLPGHHHWTVRVKYNPKYEELILSSGTDAVVNLWRVVDGLLPKSPSGLPRGFVDSLLRSYTEHEDSVYGIAWSALDPWVFASVDYDGRVMVESVPISTRRKLKGKI